MWPRKVALARLTALLCAPKVAAMRTRLLQLMDRARALRLPMVAWYWPALALGVAWVLAIAPLLWLLGASLPQADDTCVARHFHAMSFLELGHYTYYNWSGRVLSHLLIGLPGLAAVLNLLPFNTALQVGNALLLALLATSLILACRQLLGRWQAGVIAGLLLLAWWSWHLPSPVDAFYWYSANAAYTAILPLQLGFMGALLALVVCRGPVRYVAWGACACTGLALTSMHELSAALALILSLLALAYGWWWRLPRVALLGAGLMVALMGAGVLVTFLAPGNAVRIAVSGAGQPLLVALAGGLPIGLGWILAQLNVALLVWLAAWAVLVQRVRPTLPAGLWPLAAWLGVGLVGLVGLSPTLGLIANGESLPPRAENVLQFWLVWGLMLIVGWVVARYGVPPRWWRYHRYVLLALAVVIVASPTWVRAVNDTRRVAPLQQAYAAREAMLQQAALAQQPLVVPPLANIPKSAYRETLQPNAAAWQNVCTAAWYRVPSLTLQP